MASPLDTPTAVASSTHSFTVGTGDNRCLIVLVTTEGTQSGNHTCTYGGQTMTHVVAAIAGSGTTQQTVTLFYLNDAGIVAASGTTITPGNVPGDISIHAASYQDAMQTTPTNTDTDSSAAATPNPLAALDIVTGADDAVVCAGSGMGNAGSATWATPLTERTDQATASANGSYADDSVPTATTIACECTWSNQNRAAAVALELVHESAVTREQDGFRYYDDDGNESTSTALEAEDTDLTRAKESTFHLRVGSQYVGDPAAESCTLEYKENGDAASEWRKVP